MKIQIVCILLLFSIISSCKNTKAEIELIQILYYNYNFEPTALINCDEINDTIIPSFKRANVYDSQDSTVVLESFIDYTGILDATITNDTILKYIEDEILKLQPESKSDQYMDARISARIQYRNGKQDTLCIGGFDTSILKSSRSYDMVSFLIIAPSLICVLLSPSRVALQNRSRLANKNTKFSFFIKCFIFEYSI